MFCRFLSNTYHFSFDKVKPCCWMKDMRANILDVDEVKQQLGRFQRVTDWIPECNYCKYLEDAGTDSPRIRSLNETIFTEDDTIGDIVKIELQIDNDCNAACLMCGTQNSTTWQQYIDKTVFPRIPIDQQFPYYKNKTTVSDRINAVIKLVDFSKLKQIHFYGGEPFNTTTQLELLKKIARPGNIKLVYTTNGSIFPSDEVLEVWKNFKRVHICLSIDGIDDHFNYLRWPLQWTQVKEVMKKYIGLCSENFTINCSFTATPFNLFYVDKYTEWSTEFFKDLLPHVGQEWFSNPHPATATLPVNLHCIPDELQEVIKSKYPDSRLAKILVDFNPVKYKAFIEYVEFHDKHRKLSWRDTFPEIQHYFPKL